MKCTWIVESECFFSDTKPLIEAVQSLGHEVIIYNEPLYSDNIVNVINANKPIIAYCSFSY